MAATSAACACRTSGGERPSKPEPGPGQHAFSVQFGGLRREYVVHVPRCYDGEKALPALIMFHGGGGRASSTMVQTGWTEKAESAGFLAVFPEGSRPDPSRPARFMFNPQTWNDGRDLLPSGKRNVDDVGFTEAMIDDLSRRFRLDRSRIYACGFSNGSSMAYRVGAELSERIAAVGAVSSSGLRIKVRRLRRPVPLLAIHGGADPRTPLQGGDVKLWGVSDPRPPVRHSPVRWARMLGCPDKPEVVRDADGVRVERWGPGRDGSEVIFCLIRGMGHTWPGGRRVLPERLVGKTTDQVRAVDLLWDFFSRHALPGKAKSGAAAAARQGMSARLRKLFAEREAEALKKGWKKHTLRVRGRRRSLLWKGPAGAWKHGAIIAMHGGGGSSAGFASSGRLGRPMVRFAELAMARGFAVLSPDSTFDVVTDPQGRRCGKRWDCTAINGRENVDLAFIAKIIDEVIPGLRPEGSGRGVFLTGISNGGYMTILAATGLPARIAAFAPVSCGDPYGTHMDMGTHPRLERSHAPGVFRDNGTGKLISAVGAAGAAPYAQEKNWPQHGVGELPAFKQFHDRNDGVVDYSLAVKARKMLVKHGYRDAGAVVVRAHRRSLWAHFWQSAYNRPMLDFFVSEAGKSKPPASERRGGYQPTTPGD
jgi:polyhydroxybutyrate depolymerase